MPIKPKAKKPKTATNSIDIKKIPTKENIFDIRLKSLVRKFVKLRKKSQDKGKVVLELDEAEFESAIYGFKYAIKAKRLEEKAQHLLKDSRLQEDEQSKLIIQFQWAKKAIPKKGAKEKHFKECAIRLGWKPPRKGKKPTFDPDRVKEYYKACMSTLPTATQDEKLEVIKKVRKNFGMASPKSAYKYLQRHGIKGLPWQG